MWLLLGLGCPASRPARIAGYWRFEWAHDFRLRDGDWLAVFDRAVDVNPHHQRLCEDAVNFSLRRWGGTAETRDRVFDLALSNNPDAEWAKTLCERMRKKYGQPGL